MFVHVCAYVCGVCLCMCMKACVCTCGVWVCVCLCHCGRVCDVHACIPCPTGTADCSWATTGYKGITGLALDPNSGALFVVVTNFDTEDTSTVCRVPPGGGADDPRA